MVSYTYTLCYNSLKLLLFKSISNFSNNIIINIIFWSNLIVVVNYWRQIEAFVLQMNGNVYNTDAVLSVCKRSSMEFFLNVCPEFSDKIFVTTVKGLETLPASHLLCWRPVCYLSASKTHVRDRIFKLIPIYASLNSVKVTLH